MVSSFHFFTILISRSSYGTPLRYRKASSDTGCCGIGTPIHSRSLGTYTSSAVSSSSACEGIASWYAIVGCVDERDVAVGNESMGLMLQVTEKIVQNTNTEHPQFTKPLPPF